MSDFSQTPAPILPAHKVPWHEALTWCLNGLRLWRLAPFKLFAFLLLLLLIEAIVQLIPVAGVVLSKMIVPMFGVGVMIGINELAHGRQMRWACLFAAFRRRYGLVLTIAIACSLLVFTTQIATVFFVYGPAALDFVLLGNPHSELLTSSRFVMLLILPGLLPSTLLSLVTPLMLFHGLRPAQALTLGIARVCSAWKVCAVSSLISALAFALALSGGPSMLLLLLILPWGAATGYVAYRSLIIGDIVPPPNVKNVAIPT